VTIQSTFDRTSGAARVRKAVAAVIGSALLATDIFPPHPLRRSANFTGLQITVVCLALLMVAAIPILTQPLPPLEDYVNHLARMHVIASIDRDPALARFMTFSGRRSPTS
jgi:hypothetical protein